MFVWWGRKVVHVAAGAYHSLLVTEAGHVFACGVGMYGRLGLGHVRPTFTPTPVRPPAKETRSWKAAGRMSS